MKINNIDFKSSYLITPLNCNMFLEDYKVVSISDINLYFDSNTEVSIHHLKDKEIILIGYCFDIRDGFKRQENILADLMNSKNIYKELEYINGRYNILYSDGDNHYIYSDASQLRPLVYHEESKSLASHDSLLAFVLTHLGYTINKITEHKRTELDFTRYNNIYKFNPSLYLEYKNFDFFRIYPKIQLESVSPEDAFNELKKYLDESIKYLESLDNEIFVTITGGIDSRVSASLTRDFSNKIEYLTYTKPKSKLSSSMAKVIYRADKEITEDMKSYLGWNHSIINLSKYTFSDSKEKNINSSTIFNSIHSYSLANYYKYIKKYKKAVHIKSTLFGLGKADFPKELDTHMDTFDFYKLCIHGIPKNWISQPTYDAIITDYFKRNHIYEGVTKNRHYYDLFHLESRMGNWHSMITLETDPETEEFIFVNARKIIDIIQQPNIDDRRNFKLYKLIINYYWPVLSKFEINKSRKKSGNLLNGESIQFNKLTFRNVNKMNIIKTDNYISLKPNTQTIKEYDQYSFAIQNNVVNNLRKLKLTSFYAKKSSRDKIKVSIRHGVNISTYDILDLNDGINLEFSKHPITVTIFYTNDYNKISWVGAGRLQVDVLT